MAFSASVYSEVDPLQSVVLHSPGPEFDRMWPQNVEGYIVGSQGTPVPNPDYLLFDDLVLLPQMAEEHRQFADVLRAAVGSDGDVVDATYLWRRALFEASDRRELIEYVCDAEERSYGTRIPVDLRRELDGMSPERLVDVLVTGFDSESRRQVFRWPAPNLLFARDIGGVVRDVLVTTTARHPARAREMAVMQWVLEHHPAFATAERVGLPPSAVSAGACAIEGGDILVLAPHLVAIGVGHRTTWSSLQYILPPLFERGVEVALVALLPQERAAMHLDTVFTLASETECLVFSPALGRGGHVQTIRLTPDSDLTSVPRPLDVDWLRALAQEGLDLRAILCGGTEPVHQAREQWSDGANVFALAPGKIVVYGRNLRTLDELSAAGFDIVQPRDFCRNARGLMVRSQAKLAVAIDGFELSRGRGGPRCLTFPLRRGQQ